MEQCFSRLFHLSAYSDLAAVAQSSHEISRLLTEQVTCAGVPEEGAEGGREDIYQVVSFIQTNFHKPITIDQLAKEVHLSQISFDSFVS